MKLCLILYKLSNRKKYKNIKNKNIKQKSINNKRVNIKEDKKYLEKGLPGYLQRDLQNLKEGIKNNVTYLDCLINELQGSINSSFVDGDITEEQCDYLYKKYVRMEE